MTDSERWLDRYARERDADAFAALAHAHGGMVYQTSLRILGDAGESEDVAQECFLELARRAGQIKGNIGAWLHTVATRKAIDALRARKRRILHEAQSEPVRSERREASWEEVLPLVDEAIEGLPPDLREPLVMHYLEGKPQTAVAEALIVSQPTVSRRLETAIEEIRKRLGKAGILAVAAVITGGLTAASAQAAPAGLVAVLGKMAVAGVGWAAKAGAAAGTAAAGTKAITGGIAMKLGLSAVIAAVVVTGGIVVHNVVAQKQPPPAGAQTAAPVIAEPVTTGVPVKAAGTDSDDPLVQDVLMMNTWVQEERASKQLRVDFSSCQAYSYMGDGRAKVAALAEMETDGPLATERWSAPDQTLKIGETFITDGMAFYDATGRTIRYDVEKVTDRSGYVLLHFAEIPKAGERLCFVMVMQIPLSPEIMLKEGNLWHVAGGNATPWCLDYYSLELPESAILVESLPSPISTNTRNGRTVLVFRSYAKEQPANRWHVLFLWPERDQTSIRDLPPEYRGLRDAREVSLSETYETKMEEIRLGLEYSDQSTPLGAVLTKNSALVRKDVQLYMASQYVKADAQSKMEAVFREKPWEVWSTTAHFVDEITFLRTPDWPDKPTEGQLHPVYMSFPGTLIRADMIGTIFHDGKWLVIGSADNARDTDVSMFEKFK